MLENKSNQTKKSFVFFLCFFASLFFSFNWWLVFFFFSEKISAGFWFYLIFFWLGSVLLLTILFLENSENFSWLVFGVSNVLIWLCLAFLKGTSFLSLFLFSLMAVLFFHSGRKIFQKEQENQIKIQPVVSLRKPFRGLVFALAIFFATAFYFTNLDLLKKQELVSQKEEKMFVLILEDLVENLEKISPEGALSKKLNLDLTIDDYILKNLPEADKNLLGKKIQLPDGTVAVYDQVLLEELQKASLVASREQLSKQFGQTLTGQEKLFQVIGMILDQKTAQFTEAFRQIWPNLSPVLLIQAFSLFFFIIWLAGLLRWLVFKSVEGLIKLFLWKNWIKKEIRLVEKEELRF